MGTPNTKLPTALDRRPSIATDSQLFTDFSRKYSEQFLPVNIGGQNCLQPFFAGQGNYTAYDNHELGNKQYIIGGAPAGAGVGSLNGNQASYVKVPYCLEIVCGPLGATGPDLISNYSFSLVKKLADSIANAESAAGLEPIGLAGYPGLRNVTRLGDPDADTLRQPADFYSPDTFNYNVLDVSADGKTLTVTSYGINSTVQNGFVEYDPLGNPEQALFSFQIRRGPIDEQAGDEN